MVGVGIGLIVATAAADALRSLLFEVAPRDPASLAAVSVLLLLATLTAAWLPARRASRLDPMKALRTELASRGDLAAAGRAAARPRPTVRNRSPWN